MARKKYGKHSKTPAATSATARRSHVALGAATAVVGASLALGVTPAFAQTGATTPVAPAQPGNSAAQPAASANNKPANPQTPVAKQGDKKQVETKADKKQADTAEKTERGGVSSTKPAAGNNAAGNKVAGNSSVAPQAPNTVQGTNRDANPAPDKGPQANSTVELSNEKKDTLPNMYAWGSSNNVYIENGQNQEVKFILKPADGVAVTKVAIFPNDNIDINGRNAKQFVEYRTDGDDTWHQAYSGKYSFVTNNADGSATLTMSPMYRDNKMPAAGYAANRCIYVYGMKDGQEVLLYKTNIARAATLIPPKKTGSVVLKYNEELTDEQIRAKLKAALDAPTEGKDGKSLREQIKDASTAKGVGVRDKNDNRKLDTTPDDPEKKVVVTDKQAYLPAELAKINTVTSAADAKEKTYKTGVTNLKTYLVSDLGYKSEALALTVARYDTRIDKPVVTDPNSISDDVKKEIAKKLANLNHISQDKVTIGPDGKVTINFDGVDAKDAPKIDLKDLVLKQLAEADVNVPTGDKATFVANPLGYSNAELDRIKQSILDANNDNKKLGLTSKDQITLEYVKGDTTVGHENIGISNGQAENKITVKIKTDKAVAEFTSNVKESKLTKLPDIRKDYDVSWDKTKIDGCDTDEGISWSNDQKTTIIYRYDPTKAQEFDTTKILGLLKATPKDKQAGLRDLQGGEQLDHEDSNGKPRKSHMHYALQGDEPTGELSLGNMSGAYWIGNQKVSHSDEKLDDNLSEAGSYSWDTEAGSVTVAGKKGKIYKARLFVQPYAMTYYKDVYLEKGRHPGNTAKAINIIFVPQTNHKTKDLKKSVDDHKTTKVEGNDVPTESKYYNASGDKKKAYDDALSKAKTLYESVKDTDESKLTEEQKAQIDNATINLNKARAELDGPDTDKTKLEQSIDDHGKAEEGKEPTGTQATDRYKNVTEPDFKTADGKPDTKKNEAAKKAKEDYDKALEEAKALKDDENATQKAVDEAKAKLDAARAKLNDFTTSKDKLNAAIAEHGKAKYVEDAQGAQTLAPAYQNATEKERKAYDDAVAQANELAQDPNASQKDVNAAIDALQKAKAALDAKATDKSQLITAEKLTFDNPDPKDANKQSTFYKNALNKQTNGANEQEKQAAKTAVDNYNNALDNARKVLKNDKATQKEVNDAKDALTNAEKALHDNYATDANELTKVLADNFSGYLMPAYFNAFDKAHAGDKDAAAAFKNYNDAYHKAKELKKNLEDAKSAGTAPDQKLIDAAKTALEEARKAIDKYATNTSRLSAAVFNDLAIQNSPAYKNASADDASAEAKAAKDRYDKAVTKLNQALNKQMPKDKQGNTEIPTSNTPDTNIDVNNANALDNIQAHAQGEPLDRDITKILKEMNDAIADLNKFATKTDDLLKSINEDDNTKQTPAYKNASQPVFQKADSSDADADKNAKAKQAVDKYGEMLNKAKDLLKDPTATQAQINEAKKNLDDARKALLGDPKDQANTPGFNTDTTKLQKSVDKHGKEKQGDTAATEGTVTSDAYRNASDPHFMKEEGGKLVPDTDKNAKAAAAKKAYDEALTKAQELLKKHDDDATPQDAKPTQKDINAALKALDGARTEIEKYNTVTTALEAEANKSTAEGAPGVTDNDFEATPEFKNAKAKTSNGVENADVTAYNEALKKARDLVKAAHPTDPAATNSSHPTQKQINDALDALKAAKKQITDNYKTNLDKLTAAKDFAGGDFKKTPEYQNAVAKKDAGDQGATAALGKDGEQTGFDNVLKKVAEKLNDEDWKKKATQKQVNALLKQLQDAQEKIAKEYKTDAKLLENEVGDKDAQGKDVIPPFEASVPYKNALEKAKTEDPATTDPESATVKLKAYADQLEAAQKLINQVNNPDPNAKPEERPSQDDVDKALAALKQAKKDIDDKFKTKVDKLQNEVDDKNEDGSARTPEFEKSTEFANLQGKTKDGKKPDDLVAYEQALAKAKELIDKNDGKVTKDGQEVDVPKDQLPTQAQVDAAKKALKEIKDKILANYKTSPVDLQKEVDLSKDGDDDKRDDVFENTPAFKNATAKGDEASKKALEEYNAKLKAAKEMLDKFDRATGQLKKDAKDVPTQAKLDEALKALQDAKKKITDDYATQKQNLRTDYGNSPDVSNYGWASDAAKDAYKKALEDANAKLGDTNATQAEVDAAQKALKDALEALVKSANANRRAYYEDMVIDARNALQKLVDANEATHLKDLYTHAEPAAQHEFMAAMDNAKKVLADKEALASELDAARVRLLRALDGLAAHQLPGMTNAGANGNAGAGANGAAGYGAHAAGAYGRGAHAAGRVRAHAGKHLAQTSDPTNALAAAGMLASALGFIAMGFKTKKRRAK